MDWMKLPEYCRRTGDTSDSVHAKRRKGQFIDGVHTQIGDDGNLWVDRDAVNEWILKSGEKEKQE